VLRRSHALEERQHERVEHAVGRHRDVALIRVYMARSGLLAASFRTQCAAVVLVPFRAVAVMPAIDVQERVQLTRVRRCGTLVARHGDPRRARQHERREADGSCSAWSGQARSPQ
jgi:hypothetical protein